MDQKEELDACLDAAVRAIKEEHAQEARARYQWPTETLQERTPPVENRPSETAQDSPMDCDEETQRWD